MTGYYPNLISVPTEGKKISATKDYFSYTGRLAVNYLLGKNSVYASISRGRRPGVIDNGDAADTTIFLQPEIVWSYEAGIKGRIGSQLYYDFAVFYYNWDHFQSNILNTTTLKFEPEDAGKAHSFGIETGWQYYFGKGSSFFANYGYIDGRFNDKSDNGEQQQYAGNTFRLTPKHTFSAGVNFVTPLSRQTSLYIRPSYTYKSKVYFEDTPNADSLSQSGYGLVNLNAGVVFGANKLKYDISFFSKNLFDKKYLIDGGNTGELFGIPTYIGGTRLTYGIQVKVSF
jgi:outer membrane receptor protein involved in Fe transport